MEAFSIVRKKHKVPLNILGSGDWEPYKKKALELGIGEYVHYIGYVPYEKVDEYFKKAEIFVAPTKHESLV